MPRSKLDMIKLENAKLESMATVAMKLQANRPSARIKVRGKDSSYIELDGRELSEATKVTQGALAIPDKLAFSESYQYIQEAKARFDTKTAVGYSGCKANCRNALMSVLKTLTGKEDAREAAKELGKQGILGKREQDFIETFADLLVKLHGLVSKRGPHPPMTRNEDDAELALSITTSVVNYLINQATRLRV